MFDIIPNLLTYVAPHLHNLQPSQISQSTLPSLPKPIQSANSPLSSAIISTLLPTFAAYKALRAASPALLAPWLQYFIITSLVSLVLSFLHPFLFWLPLYAWLRLGLAIYLVAPAPSGPASGATYLYNEHVEPWLARHERQIEQGVQDLVERGRSAGLGYVRAVAGWLRVRVLGGEEVRQREEAVGGVQGWLAKFGLASAGAADAYPTSSSSSSSAAGRSAGAGGGDFYSMLAGALQQAVSIGGSATGATKGRPDDLAYPDKLVPPNMASPEDKLGYITAQRERLRVLLQAFDREAYNISSEEGQKGKMHRRVSDRTEAMRSRGSEADFEKVSWEGGPEDVPLPKSPEEKGGAGWMGWLWGSSDEKDKRKAE
ncbi:MAG: hypothetical protein M1822_006284 [Bathelium mastoideum]|nr:MAG: hypothetical protein M1822_006284 [Bathelium mastoideum]